MRLANKIHEVRCRGHEPGKGDWGQIEKGHNEKTLRWEATGTDLSCPMISVLRGSSVQTLSRAREFIIWSRCRRLLLRRETVLRACEERMPSSRVGIRDYRVSQGGAPKTSLLEPAWGEPRSPGKGESSACSLLATALSLSFPIGRRLSPL